MCSLTTRVLLSEVMSLSDFDWRMMGRGEGKRGKRSNVALVGGSCAVGGGETPRFPDRTIANPLPPILLSLSSFLGAPQ